MKNISAILLYFSCVATTLCYTSCRKETAIKNDHPPVANAGRDTAIDLPDNVAYLNGGGSTDPDDNITGYQWTKIEGPSTCTIHNSKFTHAEATDLENGVYQFELTVTDAGGLSGKDTVTVTVNDVLVFSNLTCVVDSVNKMIYMKTPLFPVGYSTSDISKVFLLRYPFVGGYWQEIEEDGLTADIFYYSIEGNRIIVYEYYTVYNPDFFVLVGNTIKVQFN